MEQMSDAERDQVLELLRQSGLRLDAEGRWWHREQPVEHPRLAEALHRWLDRLEDGRYVVRLDARRYAYVEVDDAPYLVRTVTAASGDRVTLHLSDGSEEELAYHTLRVGEDNVLYCQVKGGRMPARFSRPAYYLLAQRFAETEGGQVVLRAQNTTWPIA